MSEPGSLGPLSRRRALSDPGGWYIPGTLIACMWVSILSTDLYTPSLPHLATAFETNANAVHMTMSANFIGYALGPFVIGPLADRFGRKPVLSICLALFALFSALCALSPTVTALILARFAQGAAGSVVSVLVVVIIRDLFEGPDAIRVLSVYGAAIGLAPAMGPLIGGWVHVIAGWQANFWLLTLLGLAVSFAAWRLVPETGVRARLDFTVALRRYNALLRTRSFLLTGLAIAAIFAALFAYITAGPFLFIERMGVPTERYGYYYAAGVMAYITGAATAHQLAGVFSPRTLTQGGVFLSLAGALILALVVGGGAVTPLSVVIAMAVFSVGLGLTFSAAPVLMFAGVPQRRGAAAGVLYGFGQSVGAALGAFVVGALHDGTAWPLAATMVAFSMAATLLVVSAVPRRRG